jgi:DNA (cytosine-5)-methyltransferase 1
MIKIFDFFSGCGGTSRGFADAGMEVVFGTDIDPDAGASFQSNFPDATFISADIRNVAVGVLAPLIQSNKFQTLFCGCAPCQPFSKQSRTKPRSDPRRNLLGEFTRFVAAWLPDYVFVENVPGMQRVTSAEGPLFDFTNALAELGYHFVAKVLPALWFGVPQRRDRLMVLASRHGEVDLPNASHGFDGQPVSTLRDWIEGLSELEAGETDPIDPDHRAAKLSPINLARITATPEGGSRDSWPDHLWLNCHLKHDGHTDVYGRLAWDKPAAGLTTRCISYSNGRFGHPVQNRALSVREAACIQTFPRDYRFSGSMASKARQIGNAVPPLMARKVGESLLAHAQRVKY